MVINSHLHTTVQVTLLMGAGEWKSHNTQQTFREVAQYNQQMATKQASVMDV